MMLIPQGLSITLEIPQRNAPRYLTAPDDNMNLKIPLDINTITPIKITAPE